MMNTPPGAKHTESTMLALLASRYSKTSGNGPEWAFIPKVRNAAGFSATRTMDALAMSLWPSRGLELHGHEIKVSRADWLRELADASKAEAFTNLVDRWWLVVSDASIVQEGELPPTWGLMVAQRRRLVVKVRAPELPATDSPWMPRTFLAALLRAATKTLTATPAEVEAAVTLASESWEELHASQIDGWRQSRDELRQRIRAFEDASGVKLDSWADPNRAAHVGAALRLILDGDVTADRLEERLRGLLRNVDQLSAEIRRTLGERANCEAGAVF